MIRGNLKWKGILSLFTLAIIAFIAVNSCTLNHSLDPHQYGKIYISVARNSPIKSTINGGVDTASKTFELRAVYSGPGKPGHDITVQFGVDTALVDSFNIRNFTAYEALPAGNYKLDSPTAVIPAGQTASQPVEVTVTGKTGTPDGEYLLPVTITGTNGSFQLNEDLKTAYYLITSHFVVPEQKPDGQGTPSDPYKIAGMGNLKWINGHPSSWGASFVQTEDLDASKTNTWHNDEGFIPIGTADTAFTGTYDGNNHTITGLTINRPDRMYVGFFGNAGNGAVIKDLNLVQVNISGADHVGALAGLSGAEVTGVTIGGGKVTGGSGDNIGGMIGYNQGSLVKDCKAAADVSAEGDNVGGLIGYSDNGTTIQDCQAGGNVTTKDKDAGGLVGFNFATIINCNATGTVNADVQYAGGLVGMDNGSITNSYATGDVSGGGDNGGLAAQVGQSGGKTGGNSVISRCYSTGDVTGTGSHANGGFIGYFEGKAIDSCYETGDIHTEGNGATGGLVGDIAVDNVEIEHTYATGDVIEDGGNQTGGLVGYIAKENVRVEYCHATGDVTTGKSGGNTGGLLGDTHANFVSYCYATGDINNVGTAGGLIGYAASKGTIQYCFATGDVNSNSGYAGGLAGDIHLSVSNCYATGSATGPGDYTGGLVGLAWESVQKSYSTGRVKSLKAGGLIGKAASTVTDCYWDIATSGQTTSAGGKKLTTSQMQGKTAIMYMTNLDFTNVWETQANGYPVLRDNHLE